MANFPNTITIFPTFVDNANFVSASHQNIPYTELTAVMSSLGTNYTGSFTTLTSLWASQHLADGSHGPIIFNSEVRIYRNASNRIAIDNGAGGRFTQMDVYSTLITQGRLTAETSADGVSFSAERVGESSARLTITTTGGTAFTQYGNGTTQDVSVGRPAAGEYRIDNNAGGPITLVTWNSSGTVITGTTSIQGKLHVYDAVTILGTMTTADVTLGSGDLQVSNGQIKSTVVGATSFQHATTSKNKTYGSMAARPASVQPAIVDDSNRYVIPTDADDAFDIAIIPVTNLPVGSTVTFFRAFGATPASPNGSIQCDLVSRINSSTSIVTMATVTLINSAETALDSTITSATILEGVEYYIQVQVKAGVLVTDTKFYSAMITHTSSNLSQV